MAYVKKKKDKTLLFALIRLTDTVPPVVLLHHVFAIEHLVADFAGVELLTMLLLVLGEVAVG